MAEGIVHQPRVAWEGARAFVRAAYSPSFGDLAALVLDRLGPEVYGDLADSRERLLTAHLQSGGDRRQADIEAGRWRVRLEELLRTRPELTTAVRDLTSIALEL